MVRAWVSKVNFELGSVQFTKGVGGGGGAARRKRSILWQNSEMSPNL